MDNIERELIERWVNFFDRPGVSIDCENDEVDEFVAIQRGMKEYLATQHDDSKAKLEKRLKTADTLLNRFDYRLNWVNNARRPRQPADEQLRQLRKDYREYLQNKEE